MAASTGILIADFAPNHSLALAIALAILALTALLSRNSLAVYALVATGFFYLHSLRTSDSPALRLARELGEEPRPVSVRGFVASEPKIAATGSASFLLQAESIEIDGETRPCRAKLFARWRHAVEFGDEVKLFGTAERVGEPRNPGEFDMRSYLARQDVQRELIVRYPENGAVLSHAGGNLILRAAQKSREWMYAVLSRDLENSPDVTGSISGMVLGLRHQTPEDIEEPFQQTGTLHLFAVAGLHVGIVARLLWIVATVVRLPRRWATALIIPALLFYAAVTGLHTSSVRAAVMSAVLLAGFLVERKVFALNSLAAAATLILCWDTNELFSIGFQLSFSVVAAIVLLADPTYRFLRRRFEPDSFSSAEFIWRAPPHHRPLRFVARTRQLRFVRGLDRFFAVDALVLLLGYADLFAGEPRRGSDRFFRSRGRFDVDGRGTAFNVAVGCLQQRELVPDENHSWSCPSLRADPGRTFLRRAPALARRSEDGNQCARSEIWGRSARPHYGERLAVRHWIAP